MKKKCAIFCDIDGTLIKYREFSTYKSTKAEPITNTIKEINRAFNKGHNIILTTARPEYLRFHTLRELNKLNIQYHMLLMSIGRGPRILINDNKLSNKSSAYAINVERDIGMSSTDIEKYNKILDL
tara:strand:- start:536 stop:913 length:378 start_codon:yes stop_codon:yes gene_type:complete